MQPEQGIRNWGNGRRLREALEVDCVEVVCMSHLRRFPAQALLLQTWMKQRLQPS